MIEAFNAKPLETTRFLQIILGGIAITDWNDSIIENLLKQVNANLDSRDVQGNAEINKLFIELRDLLVTKDKLGIKAFFNRVSAEAKELAEA